MIEYMRSALREAEAAFKEKEVPVGAVIVNDNKIIASAHNRIEQDNDPSAHAEILAIKLACKAIDNWHLDNCEIYVTLEPCPMCAAAIGLSRIPKVVYGTRDPIMGACGSKYDLLVGTFQNRIIEVVPDILSVECEQLLKKFFIELRKKK